MHIKIKLLLILAVLALAPDRVLAQTKTYSCPDTELVCIDNIAAVQKTSAEGVSIIVHWVGKDSSGGPYSYDFFQIRYAYPGAPDTQVKLGGGSEGVYDLPLGPTSGGDYTFKVQGCHNIFASPANCYGGNQPPWDVEVFTVAPQTSTSQSALTAACPS
jgi:hypothetical protein